MTTSEESAIDAHVLKASTLRATAIGYKGLASLLRYGNVMSYAFRDYDVFVNFTRMLNHLQLQFEFVPYGLQLKPDAKINYYQNVMKRKAPEQTYQYETQRIVKEERPESGGWIRTRKKDV